MKEMERVAHEYELVTEEACSAQSFCGALLQHVLALTNDKRKIIENPAIYTRSRMTKKERQTRDSAIVEKMSKAPGKLDHASIVAVEVGVFSDGTLDNDLGKSAAVPVTNTKSRDFVISPEFSRRALPQESPPTPTNLTLCGSVPLSPSNTNHNNHHKKSGARKFFAKLRSLPSSPTSPNPPTIVSSSVPVRSFFPPGSPPPPANTPQSPPPPTARPSSPTNNKSNPTSPVKKFSSSAAVPTKYPEPYHTTVKSSSVDASPEKDTNKEKDIRKGLDLHFSPRKFPKRYRSRASSNEFLTPTSPTIPESPLEKMEGAGPVLSPQSRPRPRSCIVFESNV